MNIYFGMKEIIEGEMEKSGENTRKKRWVSRYIFRNITIN